MEIAIAGGGLGGLALAVSLQRSGLRPVVLEPAGSWQQGGYGIALWRSGLSVLDELGIGDEVRDRGAALSHFELRGEGGRLDRRVRVDAGMLGIHRTELHACLRAAVDHDALVLDAEVVDVAEERDGVALRLDDGRSRACDVVVGADGISSTVRSCRWNDWRLKMTGEMAWSWWAPKHWGPPDATVELWDRGREAFVADVGGRAVVNVAAPLGGRRPEGQELGLLAETTELLGWELPRLFAAVEEGEVFATPTHRVVARSWASDRCVLIGDAAHAVHPIAGMGASLALADARCLGTLLADGSTPSAALADFERGRRGPVRRAQLLARAGEVLTFADNPVYTRLRHTLVHAPGLDRVARHLAAPSAGRAG